MSTVEPIRKIEDLKKIEKILSKNKRDLLFFTIGTNCGLRISDIDYINLHGTGTLANDLTEANALNNIGALNLRNFQSMPN